jgi:hypothetical protein
MAWIRLYRGKRYSRPSFYWCATVKDDLLITYSSIRGRSGRFEVEECDTYHHSYGLLKAKVHRMREAGWKVIIPKEMRKIDYETGEVTMQTPDGKELSILLENARVLTEASQYN